jgi:hypothetical protein
MTWTGHGHHIPGTPLIPNDPARPDVAKCGGPGVCYFCDEEIAERKAELEENT